MKVIGGAQTYSKMAGRYEVYPAHGVLKAKGAWAFDAFGRRWLDCVSALGAVILGHGDEDVNDAVTRQLERGVAMSTGTDLERTMADLIEFLVPDGLDAVRFGKNGADVTGAAVRLARAVTGREMILMSGTGYHGHHDWSMTRGPKHAGVPAPMKALTVFYEHGNVESVRSAFRAYPDLIAAVVVEPVESGAPQIPDTGWWEALQETCWENDALLIFDEVVTGVRSRDWTWARWISKLIPGFAPDLVCLGKGIANGFPLSVLVGREEHMERFLQDVFFSTTHGGDQISLAAAIATLTKARRVRLPLVLEDAGNQIKATAVTVADNSGVPLRVIGYPARPVFRFDHREHEVAFNLAMGQQDVLWQGYVNLTLELADPSVLGILENRIVTSLREIG